MAKRETGPINPMPSSGGGGGDGIYPYVDALARFLLSAGALATVVGLAFLIYNYAGVAGSGDAAALAQGRQNVEIFGKLMLFGALGLSLGAAWLMWGEETAGPIILIGGAAFYFSPFYLPMALGEANNEVSSGALSAISVAGIAPAIIGLMMLLADFITRARMNATVGAKADQMKFGKGVKEERDVRDVLLGKCWQLPYCRKFVRERCPIYHARKCCWKERVGCMCEESVIRNAMEGTVIPSDIVAAAKYIPRNNKLTPEQKAERCRQCVIYNQHQKHKYRVFLPAIMVGIAALYVLFRAPLAQGIQNALMSTDTFVKKATLQSQQQTDVTQVTSIERGVIPYHEIILVVVCFVVLAYAIRLLEYLLFKLKI